MRRGLSAAITAHFVGVELIDVVVRLVFSEQELLVLFGASPIGLLEVGFQDSIVGRIFLG